MLFRESCWTGKIDSLFHRGLLGWSAAGTLECIRGCEPAWPLSCLPSSLFLASSNDPLLRRFVKVVLPKVIYDNSGLC